MKCNEQAIELIKFILPSLCTIIVAIISSITVVKSARKSRKEELAKNLQDNLESFYYPFLILSKKTTLLYSALSNVVKLNDGTDSNENGCIAYLLRGKTFSGNGKVLFEQILKNDITLNELIINNSNVVSNNELRERLSKLSAHYTILELAYNGQLNGDSKVLSGYSFPSDVVHDLEQEVEIIRVKIQEYSK